LETIETEAGNGMVRMNSRACKTGALPAERHAQSRNYTHFILKHFLPIPNAGTGACPEGIASEFVPTGDRGGAQGEGDSEAIALIPAEISNVFEFPCA